MAIQAFCIPVRKGWFMAADPADLNRWDPDEILPTINRVLDYIETVHPQKVAVPKQPLLSSENLVIPVAGAEPCIVIVTRLPLNRLGLHGYLWIGLPIEAEWYRRQQKRESVRYKRFKINLPPSHAN